MCYVLSCFLYGITADYDVVEMVSMQENPAYEDVHVLKKNYYSPHMKSVI